VEERRRAILGAFPNRIRTKSLRHIIGGESNGGQAGSEVVESQKKGDRVGAALPRMAGEGEMEKKRFKRGSE